MCKVNYVAQLKELLSKEMYNSIVEVAKNSKPLHCEFEMKLYDSDEQERSDVIADIVLFKGEFEMRLYDKSTKEFSLKLPVWHLNCKIDEIPEYESIV